MRGCDAPPHGLDVEKLGALPNAPLAAERVMREGLYFL
jgi:hypothetical protein